MDDDLKSSLALTSRWCKQWCSGAIAAVIVGVLQGLGILAPLESLAYVTLFRVRGTQPWAEQVVVIGIDEPTVAAFTAADWSRDLYSELLETLAIAPPQAVGFNMLLTQETAADARLATAISEQAPVVLGVAWDSQGELQAPPEQLQAAARGIGHITDFIAPQGITQQLQSYRHDLPSLSVALDLSLRSEITTRFSPPTYPNPLWINWSGSLDSIPTYSLIDVLEGRISPDTFNHKIVLVGMTTSGFDLVRTPFNLEPPTHNVYVHAAVLSNLLQNKTLAPLFPQSVWGQWLIYTLMGISLSQLLLHQRPARAQLGYGVGSMVMWLLFCVGALHSNILVPAIAPLALLGLTTSISIIRGETRAKQWLTKQTRTHPLTQLPNRAALLQHLQQQLQSTAVTPQHLGVLLIDVNRFNAINTHQGHTVGNQVLQAIAQHLTRYRDPQIQIQTIGHIGTDEFALVCQFAPPVDDLAARLERLITQLQQPLPLASGEPLFWEVTIGVALAWQSPPQAQTLLRHAEAAVYQARLQPHSNIAVFNAKLHSGAIALWQLEGDLRQTLQFVTSSQVALDDDFTSSGFYLEYQPIVALNTQQIIGFEALVRWHHPQRGILAPTEFIPLAETTGLINLLGPWVLHRACYQLRTWHLAFPQYAHLMVTVNLSPIQLLGQNVVNEVKNVLMSTGLDSRYLKLEITESHLMENGAATLTLLQRLREQGISLSLDDFGIGYSSLSRLKNLPFDTLKIDRSFVAQLTASESGETMLHTILKLAQQLKLQVIAEGIETLAQLQQLQTMGCDYGQGYFFARPLNTLAVEALLRDLPSWPNASGSQD